METSVHIEGNSAISFLPFYQFFNAASFYFDLYLNPIFLGLLPTPLRNCMNYLLFFFPTGRILRFHTFQLTHSLCYFECSLHFKRLPNADVDFLLSKPLARLVSWTSTCCCLVSLSHFLLGSRLTLIYLEYVLKELSQKRRFSPSCVCKLFCLASMLD